MISRSTPSQHRRPPSGSETPGWVESLPFFMLGGASIVLAVALLAIHSPTALAHLPVWTYLLAIGSIAVVGGTVATFVGEPVPDLPEENELLGTDLIVVSRARWKDLNETERWVEDRLAGSPEAVGAAAPPTSSTAAPPGPDLQLVPEPSAPSIDELLAGLPEVSDEAAARAEVWSESEEPWDIAPPRGASTPAPSEPRAPPAPVPESRPTPTAGPSALPRPSVPATPAAESPHPLDAELEQLLADLETEANRAVEDREIATVLPPTALPQCAGCGRSVGITERWEHCDECLSAYCDRCEDRLVQIGDRELCPTCRPGGRRTRR